MGKGKVLRIYETKSVFESGDTGSCIIVSQSKDGLGKEITITDKSHLPDIPGSPQILPFESIYGFYDLLKSPYAALVVESESYVNINSIVIRKVKKIIVVPLFRHGKLLSESKQHDDNRYLELINQAFSEHTFFYSSTFDVTHSQQRIAKFNPRQLQEPLWLRADDRFFWNKEVIHELTSTACTSSDKGVDEWITPFMSAYIEFKHECVTDTEKFALLFISRRSKNRQGCRFTKRGIDEHGNAANFVETEQILLFPDGRMSAFVQVRGSIPLHWSSPVTMKYEPPVYIDENRKCSMEWAEKHITDVLMHYADQSNDSSILFINLIDMKKDQMRLGRAFKELIESFKGRIFQPLYYIWFDFHQECKQMGKWKNLGKLVRQVDELFRSQRYFSRNSLGEVISWQTGVIRTNCMDNLDRTNVVQSLFARRSLIMQLNHMEIVNDVNYVIDSPWKSFEKIYKSIWANNANALSIGYAGTGALKVDFTKTGKRTFKGMLNDGFNSCMRYYFNNFTDGFKQDAIDLLLGHFRPDHHHHNNASSSPFLQQQQQEHISSLFIRAYVLFMVTFSSFLLLTNVAVKLPYMGKSIQEYLVASGREHLSGQLFAAFVLTFVIMGYIVFLIVKKGSRFGERMVVHPQLVLEVPLNINIDPTTGTSTPRK